MRQASRQVDREALGLNEYIDTYIFATETRKVKISDGKWSGYQTVQHIIKLPLTQLLYSLGNRQYNFTGLTKPPYITEKSIKSPAYNVLPNCWKHQACVKLDITQFYYYYLSLLCCFRFPTSLLFVCF